MNAEKKSIAKNIRAAIKNVNELIEDAYKQEVYVRLEIHPPLAEPYHNFEAIETLTALIYQEL